MKFVSHKKSSPFLFSWAEYIELGFKLLAKTGKEVDKSCILRFVNENLHHILDKSLMAYCVVLKSPRNG